MLMILIIIVIVIIHVVIKDALVASNILRVPGTLDAKDVQGRATD